MGDFIDEEPVEFEVEGKKYTYKPVTAGDEAEWLDEYIEIDEKGNAKQSIAKKTKCKFYNLRSIPYTKEEIKEAIGIDKEWGQMNKQEKWKLISKLKPEVFDKIINKMNEVDSPKEDIKKN